jgi:glutathione S-transferase
MKLYFFPVSTHSRPVVLFCAESKITYEPVVVDLMTGVHHQEPFISLNPSAQVPVLQDGDFVLTESSAILKYLADKHNSPAYPKDPMQRARVNERMDWFNTGFYREWGYHLIAPQTFLHHKRPNDVAQASTIEWGRDKTEFWLRVLDTHILGSHRFVCGDQITIADYFGAEMVATGVLIGQSFSRFSNIERWMTAMRALPSWKQVSEALDVFAASFKGKPFITID